MSPPPKAAAPKAPELGAFPLDHFRECSTKIREYFACLEKESHLAPRCREETRNYLECRMEKGLMIEQDVNKFGIPHTNFVETRTEMKRAINQAKQRGVVSVINVSQNIDEFSGSDGYEEQSKLRGTETPS